jgi:cytochrome c oxidase subunit 4
MNFEVPTEAHLHWDDSEYEQGKKDVLKTIIILSVVTVAEVGIAIMYDILVPGGNMKWAINLLMAIFSVIKVYYIMGIFMHVGHETAWFKRTILLPFLFLIWAIIAFAAEGSSWEHMRSILNKVF